MRRTAISTRDRLAGMAASLSNHKDRPVVMLMDTFWLMLPYTLLLVITGVQFFLLEQLGPDILLLLRGRGLVAAGRYLELDIRWYWWLAREGKDWSLIAILATAAFFYGFSPGEQMIMWFIGLLSGALLLKVFLSMVLLLHLGGAALPKFLVRLAAASALPDSRIAGTRRRLFWGIVFLLCGLSGLAAWIARGGIFSLLLGFICCLMGFYSFFSIIPKRQSPAEQQGQRISTAKADEVTLN